MGERAIDRFDAEAFGRRIKEHRKLCKASLAEIGERAGLTKSHVWELEQGRSRNPTVSAVWGLAAAMGISPARLLGLNDQMPPLHPDALRIAAEIDLLIRRLTPTEPLAGRAG